MSATHELSTGQRVGLEAARMTALVALGAAVVAPNIANAGGEGGLDGAQLTASSTLPEHTGAPSFALGASYRFGCTNPHPAANGENTSSRRIGNTIAFQYAEDLNVKMTGRFTNMAHGQFAAPRVKIQSDIERDTIQFHPLHAKKFPAGILNGQVTFTYDKNGATHHYTIHGFRVQYAPCK